MHLNKYIAQCGTTSRRKAVELIKEGRIRVNNTIVTDPSTQILPEDVVTYQGSVLKPEKKIYILLNKPKEFLTTRDDPEGRQTIFDLFPKSMDHRLFAVGRLDRNTTGVLLLTNDGELGQKVTHPKFAIEKTYTVTLDKPLEEKDFEALRIGIRLEDGPIKADKLFRLPKTQNKKVEITIHSGRNRIIRRMFMHLGYFVTKLDRRSFGPLNKKGLAAGRWRYLNKKEIEIVLKEANSKPSKSSSSKTVRGKQKPKAAIEFKRTVKRVAKK